MRRAPGESAYLSRDAVRAIARAGIEAGCKEALFTLGDKPELRYRAARDDLDRLGHRTTLSYLAEAARLVFEETGLLPHVNPGLLDASDLAALRKVSISQGVMLESAARRLAERGGPHHGSPDKDPTARLASIRMAGEQRVPFTTGILIGIGETRCERIEALLALRDLHDAHGHIQEIIVQNFRPKPGTRMAEVPAPTVEEHLWTIAVARLIFAPDMNIQAPPNLSPGGLRRLVEAGINDWGGVSPVTPDHVNPEAPWPHLQVLERATRAAGKQLIERLAIYPGYARAAETWVDPGLRTALLHRIDADGWPRTDEWSPGTTVALPPDAAHVAAPAVASGDLGPIIARAAARPHAHGRRHRAPVPGARRRVCRGMCGVRCAATGGQRRRRFLRRHAQHQLHQHLLVQMPVLRLLQRQDEREPARAPVQSVAGRDFRAARGRPGSAARPKSACRAASIRASPATPMWRYVARCVPPFPTCTSMPFHRSRCTKALPRSDCRSGSSCAA